MNKLLPLIPLSWACPGSRSGDHAPVEGEPPSGPSVLLITLDTTRSDRLGPYGYAAADTPAYDRLAEEGTLFLRAYSSVPLTIPSHSTILTGRYPPSHGVRDNGDFILGEDAVTLAERFHTAGWHTAAFTAAFPTQARWGFAQGFDFYHDPLKRLPTQLDWRDERRAEEVVDDAIETLSGFDGPTFAWVHLFDAHWPYDPPAAFAAITPGRPYDGEIAYAAHEVGRLLEWWDQAWPDSVVVLTADHGEGMGDGGEQTHGFLLHDGTIHVPLILRGHGQMAEEIPVGLETSDPVGHVDIAPTLLHLAGLPTDALLQGHDLREGGSEAMYSEALTGQFNLGLHPLFARTEQAGRYMEGSHGAWYPVVGDRVPAVPDPNEDLAPHALALAAMRAALDEVLAPEASLDAEALSQLMALGYVGGDPTAEAGSVDPRDVIDVIPLTWRVRQAMGAGQVKAAEEMIAVLEERMPGTFGVDMLRTQILQSQGKPLEARERYVDLYRRSPSSTVALQIAGISSTMGEWSEAESWYEEALGMQPASPDAMEGLVRSLVEQGDIPYARELAERYLAIYPDHAELALTRAEMLLLDGRADEALEEARDALDRMPRSPWAHAVTAQALWEQGQSDAALDLLQEALRLDPWNLPLRVRLVNCLLDLGRNAEAVRTITPAARLLPEDERIEALASEASAALQAELHPERRDHGLTSGEGANKANPGK